MEVKEMGTLYIYDAGHTGHRGRQVNKLSFSSFFFFFFFFLASSSWLPSQVTVTLRSKQNKNRKKKKLRFDGLESSGVGFLLLDHRDHVQHVRERHDHVRHVQE